MARKIKIPNEILKREARKEEKRKINFRQKRKYYLIVCEGQETEPNYFKGFKDDLPKGVLTSFQIDIAGTGRNTMTLVTEALRLKAQYEKNNGRPVDKLWTVFDRDSFPAVDFNNAINFCNAANPVIGCAWSNEAFELWFLLHFHFYNTGMNRTQYEAMIEANLRPILGQNYNYAKNSPEMYKILKERGNLADAIARAESLAELYDGRTDYSNHNPCTMVHLLVKELQELQLQEIN